MNRSDRSAIDNFCNRTKEGNEEAIVGRKTWYAAQRLALQLPPRRALQDDFKKGTISRAEGGQLQARVSPPVVLRVAENTSSGLPAAKILHGR
jgi:hypothetical protein